MKIIKVNIKNNNEIKTIINLIYQVFLHCNVMHSTERLIQRMKKLYGPGYDYKHTLAHFKKSTIFFIAKEKNIIIGIVR